MNLTDRLAELGIVLPPVAKPVAAYVPAVLHGDLVYVSGQLPMVDGKLMAVGKLPTVDIELAKQAAARCFLNGLAAAIAVVGDAKRIGGVVKLTGFVACAADFTGQPAIINGASELAIQIFEADGQHARSAVGVASLPLDACVEVEAIFRVNK